ncbi:MAG: hypothetical protein V1874_14330 [Spirochaetota bacterium]
MYAKPIKLFLLLSAITIITFSIGCSTLDVRVNTGAPKIVKDAKIAYIKNSFSDRDFPIFPLIPAGIYRSRSSESTEKFKKVEEKASEQIANFCAQNIKLKTGNEVIIVDQIFNVEDFNVLDNITSDIELKIGSECKKLNAAYAFIPIMRGKVTKTDLFTSSGGNHFESKIYLFDKDGKVIGKGYVSTEEEWIPPADTISYRNLIKKSEPLYKQLFDKLFQ